MKGFQFLIFTLILISYSCASVIKNATTETVKIYGNCSMCKDNIENAATQKGISKGVWSEETQMATITYNPQKTNMDDILKKIAAVGYDSDKYRAPDDVYKKLAACCQYDRPGQAAVKKKAVKHDHHDHHNH